jgi:hypothetical protein
MAEMLLSSLFAVRESNLEFFIAITFAYLRYIYLNSGHNFGEFCEIRIFL